MDTADRTETPAEQVYDGFISYSHAADGLLAPRLQAGLQRFAKPWWKRRALRIFRDESSLSANPHLWSSITDALDTSGWFVLLLSPDAAASEWVNQEIAYWVEHKDPDRIIPVLTDGEFGWDGDVTGGAVPEALRGALSEEPRWVDLRFANAEEALDLQDPRFADAVADIASAMRGVPKDELASEEVRQHRRTVRTAWAAGALVILFGAAAATSAVLALDQRSEAEANAQEAEENAAEARTEAQRADTAAREAREQQASAEASEAEALRAGQIAEAEALGAHATAEADRDPELALMLAALAIERTPDGERPPTAAIISLRDALAEQTVIDVTSLDIGRFGTFSRDGRVVYFTTISQDAVVAFDLDRGRELWRWEKPSASGSLWEIDLAHDQGLLAVSAVAGDRQGHIAILDTDGEFIRDLVPGEGCPEPEAAFSPDGRYLSVRAGGERCDWVPEEDWLEVYDTGSWEEVVRLESPGGIFEHATFSADSTRVLLQTDGELTQLMEFPSLTPVNTFPATTQRAALSPTGQQVVLVPGFGNDFRPYVYDAETGELQSQLAAVDDFLDGDMIVFSPSGNLVAILTTAWTTPIFQAETGRLVREVPTGHALRLEFTSEAEFVSLSPPRSEVARWAVEREAAPRIEVPVGLESWHNPNDGIDDGAFGSALLVRSGEEPGWAYRTVVMDRGTGDVVASFPGSAAALSDGTFVGSYGTESSGGPLVHWDPGTDQVSVLEDCVVTLEEIDTDTWECEEPPWSWERVVSGGGLFVQQSIPVDGVRQVRVRNESLEVVSEFEIPEAQRIHLVGEDWAVAYDENVGARATFAYDIPSGDLIGGVAPPEDSAHWAMSATQDGRLFFQAHFSGLVTAFSTETWAEVARWQAHDSRVRGFGIDASGTRLATTGQDDFVKVWDITDIATGGPALLMDRIPVDYPSDAIWVDENRLAIFPAFDGRMLFETLDPEALADRALSALTRGPTDIQCQAFDLDPCPTLADLRGDS